MKSFYKRKGTNPLLLANQVKKAICALPSDKDYKISITVAESKRSQEQNDKMWAMLTDISKQIKWMINGQPTLLSPEDWKDICTACLKGEQRMVPGLNGGLVLLGERTSKMGVGKMSDLIEFIYAEFTERGVKWTEPERYARAG